MPIPARVVGVAGVTTAIAGFQVTAERRRPTGLDGVHDATLREGEGAAERMPVGGAVATEDVRHFQSEPSHCGYSDELVDGVGAQLFSALRQMRVDAGGGGRAMAQPLLNQAQVDAGFQQMGGPAVT